MDSFAFYLFSFFCHVTSHRRLRTYHSVQYFSVCSFLEYQSILILLESCITVFYDTHNGFWSILSFCSSVLMEWRPFIYLADYEERLLFWHRNLRRFTMLLSFQRHSVPVTVACCAITVNTISHVLITHPYSLHKLKLLFYNIVA
jgi:hypothetical protein